MRKRPIPKPFDRLHPAKAARIVTLHGGRLSQRLIALEVGVSQATVSRVLSQHLAALSAPVSSRAASLEIAPAAPKAPPVDPRKLYHDEKARRAERLKANSKMADAANAFAALLERERQAGRGGRPKGSKNSGAFKVPKAGKPMILAVKSDPADALLNSLGEFYGAA